MKIKYFSILAAGILTSVVSASPSFAAITPSLITFESIAPTDIISITNSASNASNPSLISNAPNIYVSAGPSAQSIVSSPATFDGGVLLGLATNFPAQAFASGANVYGTADFSGYGLKNLLSISTNNPTTAPVNEVSFALFNGETFTESYNISVTTSDAVYNTTISNIASNWQSGYALVDLVFPSLTNLTGPANILNVSISSALSGGAAFDFLIDSVAFNQPLTPGLIPAPITLPKLPPPPVVETVQPIQATELLTDKQKQKGKIPHIVNLKSNEFVCPSCKTRTVDFGLVPAVPEPESYAMMIAGLGVMGFVARRRRIVR